MSTIKTKCPECAAGIKVAETAIGKRVACPKCGEKFTVVESPASVSAEKPKLPGKPIAAKQATTKLSAAKAMPVPVKTPAAAPLPSAPKRPSKPPPAELVDDYDDEDEDDEEEVRPARRATKVVIQATPPQGSSSLGIAALVCGVIAVLTSWIPLLGIVGVLVALLALALGGIGIVLALMRRGRAIGFSIAGGTLAFIAIGVFAFVHAVIDSAIQTAANASEKAAKQARAELAKAGINAPLPPMPAGVVPPLPGALDPVDEKPPEPAAVPFGQWAKIGDVSVRIAEAKIGLVPIKLLDETTSKDPLLMIDLEIRNDSAKKKIDYSTWRGKDFAMERDFATLKDDSDNTYKRVGFSISTKIIGAVDRNESIYPGKSIRDRLVFELPIDAAEMLILDLPSNNLGVDGSPNSSLSITLTDIRR